MARAHVFLTLVPRWADWATEPDGSPSLKGMDVGKMTKTRPRYASGPVVELVLEVPDAAFKPLRPTVKIKVPEQALDFEPVVTVTGVGPVEGTCGFEVDPGKYCPQKPDHPGFHTDADDVRYPMHGARTP